MISTWNRLEGLSLAGQYGLNRCLGESGNAAFFLSTVGAGQQPAVVKLFPEEAGATQQQLELWRYTARLTHPNLLCLLDYGRADLAGDAFLYAVLEYPDDDLAGALERGPLSEAEARDVLVAAMAALRYIHSQGLVHTALDPGHIVAVGNQIKLSSDTLARPSRAATTAGDVRALGALLYQLITARPLPPGKIPDLSAIPDPFRSIVLHSVEHDPNRRWTLAQIAEALNPPPSPPLPLASPQPVEPPTRSSAFPKWAYLAVAALVAFLVVLFAPKAPAPPLATAYPEPRAANPQPLTPPVVAPTPAAPAAGGREFWRVIVYTYRAPQAAEKKARSIHANWAGVETEVFSPNGPNRPPFLVAIGGRMTRDQAVTLLKMARGKGMPRDTYIQNYSR